MKFALFYHSVRSDWNHGNAHFLRGVMRALAERGHEAVVLERADAWSCSELVKDQGAAALEAFERWFPDLRWQTYPNPDPDLDLLLDGVDVAIVHEWTDPAVVAALGRYRRQHTGLTLLFHDTHHRMVSEPDAMARLDLDGYDGVLAFGAVLADAYRRAGWGRRVYTWHEAADVTTFHPRAGRAGDEIVWVGNWGDGERAEELTDYLLEPVRRLEAPLVVHGVRYPEAALTALARAGADYRGWIPGPRVAEVLSQCRFTVHVPRRWYRERLAGIPTIRMFEALACAAPLISAPWQDTEGLFRAGTDYLPAANPAEMQVRMVHLLDDADACAELGRNGLERILERHTCGHRVAELLQILRSMGLRQQPRRVSL
ncbi:MAG TPA: glycosyltransferase [Pseudomonadales bacterium]